MSHRRVNKRTVVIAGAAAAALAGAAVLLPNANASPDKSAEAKTFSSQAAVKLATGLASDLGGNAAGWYYQGDTKQLVMNVLNEDAANDVQAKGAVAKIVANSLTELKATTKTLSDNASIPGTAWSIDPKTNKVRVLADRTVTGTKWASLTKAVDGLAGKATVQRTNGEFKKFDGTDETQPGANGGADQGGADDGAGQGAGQGGADDGAGQGAGQGGADDGA
ncbi:S1 family peptidase, partial [Streptomyces sp. MCAF7]